MDQIARAAFITAMAACCQAKLTAMTMQNTCDLHDGRPVTYLPEEFAAVPDEFGLSHNAVLTYLMGV